MKNKAKETPTFDDLFDGLQSKPLSPKEERAISEYIKSQKAKNTRRKKRTAAIS
jgi:hypothetical protein